jgi:hypothetical protein
MEVQTQTSINFFDEVEIEGYTVAPSKLTSKELVDLILDEHEIIHFDFDDQEEEMKNLYDVRKILGEENYFYYSRPCEDGTEYFLRFKTTQDLPTKFPYFDDYPGKINTSRILNNYVEITEYDGVAKIACGTPAYNDILWKDLKGHLPSTIEALYLNHDGIIGIRIVHKGDKHYEQKNDINLEGFYREEDKIDDVKEVISELPELRHIEYCAYYSKFAEKDFEKIFEELGRDIRSLTCASIS